MTSPMIPRERCDYSAIVDRPALKLPGGARIVIWTIVNLEVWDIGKPMARQVIPPPTGIPLLPVCLVDNAQLRAGNCATGRVCYGPAYSSARTLRKSIRCSHDPVKYQGQKE